MGVQSKATNLLQAQEFVQLCRSADDFFCITWNVNLQANSCLALRQWRIHVLASNPNMIHSIVFVKFLTMRINNMRRFEL